VLTIRQQLINVLEKEEMNARELSRELKIREKEVYEHLYHIKRSIKTRAKKLHIDPFHCLVCGYIFEDRRRLSRPGRCPKCKEGHIEAATYRIA